MFLDDDVRVREGWLAALLAAARAHPGTDVFAGRITARLEGPAPRGCGRELPPITTLDLGERDVPTAFAWGSNMAIRRSALERVGPFDVTLQDGGDEQEWQERAGGQEPGARALYVAGAWVEHRRAGADARLRALCRAAHARGRAARRFDARRGRAPRCSGELLTLAGCLLHVLRRNCPAGLTMAAHSAGRLRQALAERARPETPPPAPPEEFLSGASGTVAGSTGCAAAPATSWPPPASCSAAGACGSASPPATPRRCAGCSRWVSSAPSAASSQRRSERSC